MTGKGFPDTGVDPYSKDKEVKKMSLSTNSALDAYSTQAVSSYAPTQKTAEVKKTDEAAATAAAVQNTKAEETAGATVEISDAGKELAKKVTGMSEEDRAQMVQQLKADQESFQSRFIEMVEKAVKWITEHTF